MVQALPSPAFRCPVRVTITIPHHTHQELVSRCDEEGRSLSNLAAYLLESSLAQQLSRLNG